MNMDAASEILVLLARVGALEGELVKLDERLAKVEKRIETDEKRLVKLEQSTDSGRDRLPQ